MSERNGVCVALFRGDTMLVVRTRRYPAVWQPIGGGISGSESPVEAALREVQEETGWALEHGMLSYVMQLPMDAHAGTLTFFVADAPDGEPQLDAGEIAEHQWVTPTGACSLDAFSAARTFFAHLAG